MVWVHLTKMPDEPVFARLSQRHAHRKRPIPSATTLGLAVSYPRRTESDMTSLGMRTVTLVRPSSFHRLSAFVLKHGVLSAARR